MKENTSSDFLSITNENFEFKTSNENGSMGSISKREHPKNLQSPVESHFALTPTTNSESSSPKNGFTSTECSNLLQEELDQLVLNEKESKELATGIKINPYADGLQSPAEETISMFSRIENTVIIDNENEESTNKTSKSHVDNTSEVSRQIFIHFP